MASKIESFVESVLKKEFPLKECDHKHNVSTNFFENIEKAGFDLEGEYHKRKSAVDRVKLFKKFFEWMSIPQNDLTAFQKDKVVAQELLKIAKDHSFEYELKSGLQAVNVALMFTPEDETLLIDILSTRASLLADAEQPHHSIEDNEWLSQLLQGKPETCNELIQLQKRDTKCQKIIVSQQFMKSQCPSTLIQDQERRLKYRNNFLFKIKQPNPKMVAAENFVQALINDKKGRHMIVTRDVPPATTLIVEEPYVKVLKDGIHWEVGYCHFCFVSLHRGLPCPTCVFAFYCSENCRQNAYIAYHQYECPCLPYIHATRTPRYIQLVLRTVWTAGAEKLYKIWVEKDPLYFDKLSSEKSQSTDKNLLPGTNPQTETYESDSYYSIFHLLTHTGKLSDTELSAFTNILQAIIFSEVINRKTNFFTKIKESMESEKDFDSFLEFFATLLLHHIESIPFNSISLDAVAGLESIQGYSGLLAIEPSELQEKIRELHYPQYGAATYALCSLINHSCSPNVTRVPDLKSGKMAIVTLRGMRAGEELVTSYSRGFLSDDLKERRNYLQQTYNFWCQCIACEEQWPEIIELTDAEAKFLCPVCMEKGRPKKGWKCIVIDSKDGKCSQCKKIQDLESLQKQLMAKTELFFHAYEMVLQNRPFEAIRAIAPVMQFFQKNILPPYARLFMSQDMLKRALDLIVHFSEEKF